MTADTETAVSRAKRILVDKRGADSLQDKVKQLREAADIDGMRRIHPLDILEIEPSPVNSKPPEPMHMAPTDLWVDGKYQRHLSRESLRLILKIIANWSWQKFKPPVVTRDADGRYCIIDGQHTSIAAASHPGIDKIPVMFIPIDSLEEAALAFIAHNNDRVLVTPYNKFKARLVAGDETAVGVMRILNDVGIQVTAYHAASGSGEVIEPNQTAATAELERRYEKLGEARFLELMRHVAACGFKPIRRDHIAAFAELLYGEHKEGISPELLVEVVTSLSDADSLMAARRLAHTVKGMTTSRALAMHYQTRYQAVYPGRKRRAAAAE